MVDPRAQRRFGNDPVNFRDKPIFKTERANDRKPFKPKPWSHQAELQALKGKPIQFLYIGAAAWGKGTLIEADQFALKIEITSEKEGKSVLTIYKHALCGYRAG